MHMNTHTHTHINIPTYMNTYIIRKVKAYVIELIMNNQVKNSSDL